MRQGAIAFVLLGVVGLFGGCSNALTESSAVEIFQKFLDDKQTDQQRKLGRIVVDSCDQLLLVTETRATARCKVHIKATAEGAATLGNPPPVTMKAEFGKQPDGKWVGTGGDYF